MQLRTVLRSLCLALLGLQALVGCSLLVDAERLQCSTNKDCEDRGSDFAGAVCINAVCERDPKWACAENTQAAPAQVPLQVSFSILSIFDFGPMPGVHGTLCGNLDLACLAPLGQADSDASGNLLLDLPQAFTGYIKLDSDAIEPMLFFPRLPIKEGDPAQMVFLSPKGAKQSLATQLGDTVDTSRGMAVVLLYDCQEVAVAGGSVELLGATAGSHLYYAFDGTPSPTATVMDQTGMAGVLNAAPGTLGIRFKRGDKVIAQTSMLIREGYMSYRAVYVGDTLPAGFQP